MTVLYVITYSRPNCLRTQHSTDNHILNLVQAAIDLLNLVLQYLLVHPVETVEYTTGCTWYTSIPRYTGSTFCEFYLGRSLWTLRPVFGVPWP